MRLDHDEQRWASSALDHTTDDAEQSRAASAVYTIRSDQMLWALYTRRSLNMRLPVPYQNFA